MPHWEVVALIESVYSIQAQEQLLTIQSVTLGSGFVEVSDRQEIIQDLIRKAGLDRPLYKHDPAARQSTTSWTTGLFSELS